MTQKMKFQILNADGTPYVADAKVGCINQILQPMWKQVDMYVKGQLMTSSDTNYTYHAIFQTLLNYGTGAKLSQLQSELFYKDTTGTMDASDPTEGGNTGPFARSSFTKESNMVQEESPLMTDLNYLDRLITNGIRIGIKFTPNPEAFSLMSATENAKYRFEIVDHRP